jgi:hypothetical protein
MRKELKNCLKITKILNKKIAEISGIIRRQNSKELSSTKNIEIKGEKDETLNKDAKKESLIENKREPKIQKLETCELFFRYKYNIKMILKF